MPERIFRPVVWRYSVVWLEPVPHHAWARPRWDDRLLLKGGSNPESLEGVLRGRLAQVRASDWEELPPTAWERLAGPERLEAMRGPLVQDGRTELEERRPTAWERLVGADLV